MNRFAQKLAEHSISLSRGRPEILQVNVGKLCNLTCMHCHVNAGPKRKEIMARKTSDRIIDCPARTDVPTVDLPVGAFLPPSQNELEADYKRELKKHFGIVFNNLYTLTNLPIGRFASYLWHNNKLDEYMELLIQAFNPATIDGLMCRNTVSVGWRGEVYDCDFNQQLGMQWSRCNGGNKPMFLWDVDPDSLQDRQIMTGDHCFGCTAGAGSSCGGAIL